MSSTYKTDWTLVQKEYAVKTVGKQSPIAILLTPFISSRTTKMYVWMQRWIFHPGNPVTYQEDKDKWTKYKAMSINKLEQKGLIEEEKTNIVNKEGSQSKERTNA